MCYFFYVQSYVPNESQNEKTVPDSLKDFHDLAKSQQIAAELLANIFSDNEQDNLQGLLSISCYSHF